MIAGLRGQQACRRRCRTPRQHHWPANASPSTQVGFNPVLARRFERATGLPLTPASPTNNLGQGLATRRKS